MQQHLLYFVCVSFMVSVVTPLTVSSSDFSWNSCGSPTDPVKIMSLNVTPGLNRTLLVTGRSKVGVNLTSTIQGKLEVKRKLFIGWTHVPCVSEYGSCTYDDVCKLSPYTNETCPKEFINNQLPCTCPILQGLYAAKNFPISLASLPEWLEAGHYRITANLTVNQQPLVCLFVEITVT